MNIYISSLPHDSYFLCCRAGFLESWLSKAHKVRKLAASHVRSCTPVSPLLVSSPCCCKNAQLGAHSLAQSQASDPLSSKLGRLLLNECQSGSPSGVTNPSGDSPPHPFSAGD